MLKAIVIVLICVMSAFSWTRWVKVRAPDTCWEAGNSKGYSGNGGRSDYEPAQVAMLMGYGMVGYEPSSWKKNAPPEDRSVKLFFCTMELGRITEVNAADWEQTQNAPVDKN